MSLKFDQFCGNSFWDNNLSWNTNSPELTECFNKTILVWIPFIFLLLFSPILIRVLIKSNQTIAWNYYNKIRQIVATVSVIIAIAECVAVVVKHNDDSLDNDTIASAPDIIATIVRLISALVLFGILWAQVKCGIHTSGVIWFYLCLAVICNAPTLHGNIYWHRTPVHEFIFFCIQYLLTIVLFVIYCFADKLPKNNNNDNKIYDNNDDISEDKPKECPKDSASFLSRLLFSWFTSLAIQGWKSPLTVENLWQIRHGDKSFTIYSLFNNHWLSLEAKLKQKTTYNSSQQLKTNSDNNSIKNNDNQNDYKITSKTKDRDETKHKDKSDDKRKASVGILQTMYRTFWFYFIAGAFFKLINDVLTFISPQLMSILMSYIKNKTEETWHGYLYAILLFINTMFQVLSLNYYFNRMMVIGMRIRTCLVAAIYRKSLRLSNTAKTESTTGEIVNLMAVDAQRFIEMTQFINLIWSAPLQIVLAVYFLWQELGISVLGGLAVMAFMVPINGYLTKVSKKLQIKQMKLKDERVKAMNEILSGIKVLKLYGWEQAFMDDILKIRNKELRNLRTINYIGCALMSLWMCAPFFVSFITFAIYVLMSPDNELTAQKAFVSLALFNILRFPLSMLPYLVTNIILTSVSVKRLNKFLNAPELSGYVQREFNNNNAVEVNNGSFSWKKAINESDDCQTILHRLNIEIKKNSFVAIVGSVGSGKSSLLSALLGDMEIQDGSVNICSSQKIAYVPQQAWIQNSSLKNNILFGNSFDEKRYKQVIDVCALKPDLDILPGGDETEIGEKGINLSGGQKQRVSVARACFTDSNLYLLDDPLSAVDSHVGKYIFEEVLDSKTGFLKDKTRILVTNSLAFLPSTDKIIVLKDGAVSETGTFNELIKFNGHFADLIKQYSANSLNKEEKEVENQTKKTKSGTIKETNNEKAKLVEVERAETGRVKYSVYFRYFKAITWFWCINVVVNYGLMQAATAAQSVWLSEWSTNENNNVYYLIIYGVLGVIQIFFVSFGWYALTKGTIKAAKFLHLKMLEQIMHSPMSFFDTTPLGRILNRFSKDVDTCDLILAQTIRVCLTCGFATIATIVVISIEIPIFLAIILPIAIIFYIVQKFYITTSRQLKRLESITKSPIYAHFSETLTGVSTIRAYGVNKQFIKESDNRLDLNNRCFYPNVAANRWLSIRLEMVANIIIFFSALFAVIYREKLGASEVGLIVSYALNTTQNLNWLVRCFSDLETNIVGVERILEYTDLKTEAEWYIEDTAPQSGWPIDGNIDFDNYSTKYREGLDLVIKQISIKINSGERIGIVGRTGAGKSSLTLALFRLIEATEGNITIDGINISDIGLHQLRSRLTIIPQDPVLFSGTIRQNLDPFNTYTDEDIWKALELSHLKTFVSTLESTLEYKVSEGGENLSVGQRQLICLARALLRHTKVLILDEATAAVDLETDSLIQQTIRKAFADCTVLTIAHRLHTILDSTRVLVLNEGRIAEFDSPDNLLADENSVFYSLAKDAGIKT
ncbi:multidrug resistance-associated protein 1-like [Oppia nitens]|uniref:multidrug resistance-associated protein 1-like n=1 Tax=Oppia nitens TaxID=1686743 RepID=UPI0023DBB698|nr:multidrug resistance-associated protein 1-like [Oppia nitens]